MLCVRADLLKRFLTIKFYIMIQILKKYNDNTFDVVSETEVAAGRNVIIGYTKGNEPIYQPINSVIEQRKERGTYIDESKRRFWAKVS